MESNVMFKEKRSDNLHKASSILSFAAILLSISLFVRMETVVHDTKMMDSKFTLQIQQIRNALKGQEVTHQALAKEDFDIIGGNEYERKIIRRSLKTNHNYSDLEVGDNLTVKRYVSSIVAGSLESYCLAPGRVCVAGPPGLKGVRGICGKRGHKGTRGKKGAEGVMGFPGEPGEQGMKGDLGTPGIKGEKGAPGHPGPKGEPGESISAPEVIVSPASLTVTQHQTATFYCFADGYPKPSVSWSKISGAGLVNTDGQDNKLQIRNAGYNDSGSYICTAANILGHVQKVVKLFVAGFWKSSVIIGGNAFYRRHLHQFLTPAVGSQPQWVLCYRASTHGWRISTFHSRCDGKNHTVIIVKNGQFVFGGYTDIPWDGSRTYGSTPNAFIFSLRNKEGLSPFKSMVKTPSNAIFKFWNYGPCFGNADFQIADNANRNINSYTWFGSAYSLPSGVQDRETILAGTHRFTPDDWEVFYLG